MTKHYVYRFINRNNQVIYVGETNNINRRIREHLSCNPKRTSFRKRDIVNTFKIECITVRGVEYGKLVEGYYILKHKSPVLKNKAYPKHNIKIKNPPTNWRTYLILHAPSDTNNTKHKLIAIIIQLLFWMSMLYYFFK